MGCCFWNVFIWLLWKLCSIDFILIVLLKVGWKVFFVWCVYIKKFKLEIYYDYFWVWICLYCFFCFLFLLLIVMKVDCLYCWYYCVCLLVVCLLVCVMLCVLVVECIVLVKLGGGMDVLCKLLCWVM